MSLNRYTVLDDLELIRLCKNDDRRAFDAIYSRHWQDLYQFAFFLLRDKAACMDILQDVFVSLWERRIAMEVSAPKSYLRAAVRFGIAKYIRAGKVRAEVWEELATPHTSNTVEEDLDLKELQTIVRQTVSDLPERCQEIYRLSRHEYLTNQQIADRLGISVKAVERQMTIALKRIRSVVEACLIGFIFFSDKFHS